MESASSSSAARADKLVALAEDGTHLVLGEHGREHAVEDAHLLADPANAEGGCRQRAASSPPGRLQLEQPTRVHLEAPRIV